MEQLRRFSSVGAWIWAFGVSAYGIFRIVEKSKALDRLDTSLSGLFFLWFGMMVVAAVSFLVFLQIGGHNFECKRDSEKK